MVQKQQYYGTGRRKSSSARVFLRAGKFYRIHQAASKTVRRFDRRDRFGQGSGADAGADQQAQREDTKYAAVLFARYVGEFQSELAYRGSQQAAAVSQG